MLQRFDLVRDRAERLISQAEHIFGPVRESRPAPDEPPAREEAPAADDSE